MKAIGYFVSNGFTVLKEAAGQRYTQETDEIRNIKKELFEVQKGSFHTDKQNLLEDKKAICRDVKKVYNEMIVENG